MKKLFLTVFLMLSSAFAYGQNTLRCVVKDKEKSEPLIGVHAVVAGTSIGGSSDTLGVVEIENFPNGRQTIVFSYIGYETQRMIVEFPLPDDRAITVYLEHGEIALAEVTVSSTRSSRAIEDEPTRVEPIVGEELDEKTGSHPANISMLFKESTGIQVQQTSAVSANANIRMQGLEGKYTQLLKDGFPLYSGLSSGLSIMQIPPLDLQQVEVIKGSVSTLYGGGAIAGLINLVTKEPAETKELDFLVNVTSAKGWDFNGYYAQKFKKLGVSLYATANTQAAFDPNGDGFTDLPKTERYNFNPRFFYYWNGNSKLSLGVNLTGEDRLGGDLQVINASADSLHIFTERNTSRRFSTQLEFEKKFSRAGALSFKNSVQSFARTIELPGYAFEGTQVGSFSELNYAVQNSNFDWILGLNLWTDRLDEYTPQVTKTRDYHLTTLGAFVQNTWKASPQWILETGVRSDYVQDYGFFFLPRAALLVKANPQISSRVGGGLGYLAPTIFTEESEEVAFRNVLPIARDTTQPEASWGGNWDINFRTALFADLTLSINQLFYYTRLRHPLVLNRALLAQNIYKYENANGHVDTRGFETDVKLTWKELVGFAGYSFTDTKRAYHNLNNPVPLTARHRLNATLMLEAEEHGRIGYEMLFMGGQVLSDGTNARNYILHGVMAEKRWEQLILYVNFENIFDVRQSRWQPMFTGSPQNPSFVEIYAPTDGFIFNGGVKIRL